MSWLSELFSSSSNNTPTPPPPTPEQVQAYYDQVKIYNPAYYETVKMSDPKYLESLNAPQPGSTPTPGPAPAPVGGPSVALQRLNDALGSDVESRYLPDTLDDPFVSSAVSAGRGKADEFINNMLKRGTLTEQGRQSATGLLDAQTAGATKKISDYGAGLLGTDRANITNLINTGRQQASATPEGTEFDPTALVNQIAAAGQGSASSFGDRFASGLPAGDLFDTSGIGGVGGAVTSPQNIQFDPYSQEGGKLNTGLDSTSTAAAPKKKRTTAVF